MADHLPDKTITPAIREEAARLFGDHIAGIMSAQDEAQLEIWLSADERHARAFAAIERMWLAIDQKTMPVEQTVEKRLFSRPSQARSARRQHRIQKSRRSPKRWIQGVVAASLASIALWQLGDLPVRLQADVRTGTGEQRTLTLSDGSVVRLNTGSAIAIDYDRERRLRLIRGEAAFTVAPDPLRPFIVEAGDGNVTALGTRFLIRMEKNTQVSVTQHSVRVRGPKGETHVVQEGEAVYYGKDTPIKPQAVSVSESDAWTRGVIRVVNKPLGEVVHEIGRYHRGYIAIANSKLAARPVNGVFYIDTPMRSIDAIEKTLNIRSTRIGKLAVVLHD